MGEHQGGSEKEKEGGTSEDGQEAHRGTRGEPPPDPGPGAVAHPPQAQPREAYGCGRAEIHGRKTRVPDEEIPQGRGKGDPCHHGGRGQAEGSTPRKGRCPSGKKRETTCHKCRKAQTVQDAEREERQTHPVDPGIGQGGPHAQKEAGGIDQGLPFPDNDLPQEGPREDRRKGKEPHHPACDPMADPHALERKGIEIEEAHVEKDEEKGEIEKDRRCMPRHVQGRGGGRCRGVPDRVFGHRGPSSQVRGVPHRGQNRNPGARVPPHRGHDPGLSVTALGPSPCPSSGTGPHASHKRKGSPFLTGKRGMKNRET